MKFLNQPRDARDIGVPPSDYERDIPAVDDPVATFHLAAAGYPSAVATQPYILVLTTTWGLCEVKGASRIVVYPCPFVVLIILLLVGPDGYLIAPVKSMDPVPILQIP